MIPLAFTFVITALWLILSPWSLSATLTLNGIILVISVVIALYSALKSQFWRLAHSLSIITGILVSTLLYIPALKDYQTISHNLPQTVSALFQIERNQYPTSTTIQIISAQEISTTTHESSDSPHLEKPPTITENHEVPANFYKALQGSTLRVYNIHPDIKASLQEGERYQGTISLRPRYFRNIPGDNQRIYQALARKEIGYGRFESPLQKVAPQSFIEHFRQQTASYFVQQFQHGSYLSALSVGITHYLSEKDWEYLRQTGTIHLVSISGLHLSLTAFYAFIIFRMIAGLLAIRCISPYKIAAFLSVIYCLELCIHCRLKPSHSTGGDHVLYRHVGPTDQSPDLQSSRR